MPQYQGPAQRRITRHDVGIEEAAVQFVRKISGYLQPSPAKADVFDQVVSRITLTRRKMAQLNKR